MIHWLHVKNFRSLRDTLIKFTAPVTAIIGPNNAGKTSVIQAVDIIRRLVFNTVSNVFKTQFVIGFTQTQGTAGPVEFALNLDFLDDAGKIGQYEYAIAVSYSANQNAIWVEGESLHQLSRNGKKRRLLFRDKKHGFWRVWDQNKNKEVEFHGDPTIQAIYQLYDTVAHKDIHRFKSVLNSTWIFDLNPHTMKNAVPISPNAILNFDGSNLAAVVDSLVSENPQIRDAFVRDLKRIIPEISGVLPKAIEGGNKILAVQELSLPREVYAFQASDGLLRAMAMLAAIHAPQRPMHLFIEEPENGLHPARLEQIVDCLRTMTTKEQKKLPQRQAVFTTHAPYLVDKMLPEEVLIAKRDQFGTHFHPIKNIKQVRAMLENASLGELWHRGSIGGVPLR